MNFGRCIILGDKEYRDTLFMSFNELKMEVFEITKKQNYITHCGLSDEVTALTIKEL